MITRRHLVALSAGSAMASLARPAPVRAQTQTWPNRFVKLVVPFTPGGGVDINARLIAPKLQEYLGQPVIVESRPGAGTNIGNEFVAKSPPDGYTLLINSGPMAINMALYKNLNYDTLRDFVAISLFSESPNVLVVHPSLPVKTAKELAALARSKPGEIVFSSSGPYGVTHTPLQLFMDAARVKMRHLPTTGGGPAITAILGNNAQVTTQSVSATLPHVKSGRLIALAVTSAQRSRAAAEIPTVAESGFPGFEMGSWHSILVPAKTPKPIIARLHAELVKTLAQPDVRERFASQGLETVGSTPEQFREHLKRETAKYARIIKAANIKGE